MADEPSAPNNSPGTSGQSSAGTTSEATPQGFFGRLSYILRKDNVEGDAHVSAIAIILTALFLMTLTILLLIGLTQRWPACELPEENVNANVAGANANAAPPANRNASVATGANANSNVNVNANAAANTNTSANANTDANTNAGAQANTNTNANAGADTTTTPTTGETGTTVASVDIDSIDPKSGPITGKTLVTIKGKNFGTTSDGVRVKFDGIEAKISKVSEESITARTPPHSEGAVDVTVEKGDKSDVLPAEYTYTCPTPTGTNLFYMLIFAGALGSCIHAMRSLFWYVGQRELRWSWLPMYYVLPFIGAAMAMLFGLLIFAGLFDNNTGRAQSLFIIAIAGLVGMFSQQAALKLADIANAVFTKPEPGKEAEPQKGMPVDSGAKPPATPSEAKINPSAGPMAGSPPVEITNTGLSDVASVTFGTQPGTNVTFDATTSTLTVTPPDAAKAGKVEVEIKDGAGKLAKGYYTYEEEEEKPIGE
jgi:hypothetical protein